MNDPNCGILFIVFLVVIALGIRWIVRSINDSEKQAIEKERWMIQQREEAQKRMAFQIWYNSLPLHEQYIVNQQLKALEAQQQQARNSAMMGLIMTQHNQHHWFHNH